MEESGNCGMKNVIATVSGYEGIQRANLIKLIALSGASYVGALSPSITHLVCFKFEGKKYKLAKKLRINILNHRWVEDCILQGKCLPEYPYTLQRLSRHLDKRLFGAEVGQLSLEPPISKKEENLNNVKSYGIRSNIRRNFSTIGEEEVETWKPSRMLRPEMLFDYQKNKNSSKLNQLCEWDKNLIKPSNSQLLAEEFPVSKVLMEEYKRRVSPSPAQHQDNKRKRLRLKNQTTNIANRNRNTPDAIVLDSDDENEEPRISSRRSPTEDLSHKNTNEESAANGTIASESWSHNSNEEHDKAAGTCSDLSCAICWTEFSSTRGILHCGHRFCYQCIEQWSNHLSSMRKSSTCPLCKATFSSIMKVEGAATADQKMYSQTMPFASSSAEILLPREVPTYTEEDCCGCRSREPEEMLAYCGRCEIRCIHVYCMDPFVMPWICVPCKQLGALYSHM